DLHLFYRHAPERTQISTLSLHDALPICGSAAETGEVEVVDQETYRGVGGFAFELGVFADAADLKVAGARGAAGPGEVGRGVDERSEEHTAELQSRENLVCRLLLGKKKKQ